MHKKSTATEKVAVNQEQAVKPIEIELQEFLELIPDPFVLLDEQGRIRRVNAKAECLFGYASAELCGQLIEILVPERLRSAHAQQRQRFTHAAASRPMGVSELPLLCRDGSEVPVAVSLSVIATQAGERMVSAVVRDMRERKRAEEQIVLQASLLAQIEDAVMACDLERRVFYWNKGAEKIFGWTSQEALGKTTDELFGLLQPGSLRDQAKAALLSRRFHQGEMQLRRQDGADIWVDAKTAFYCGPRGDKKGYIASFRDITERKAIEADLLAKREIIAKLHSVSTQLIGPQALPILLQAAVEAAVTIAHAAMGMVHTCDAASQSLQLVGHVCITAAMVEQFTQIPIGATYGEMIRQRQWLVVENSAEGVGLLNPHSLDILLRAGICAGQSTPIRARDGRLLGVVTTLYHEPRFPSELVLQTLDLLAHEASYLIEARQREATLQHAIRARDQTLGIVAHDLRNPLNNIMLRAQLLNSQTESHHSKASTEAITRDARRMNRLIQDLLDVTSIESGTVSLELGPISVSKIVKEAVEAHQLTAVAASLRIQICVESDLTEVFADHYRLRQVFDNLIGNAIKFTPSGGCITIGAAARDDEVLFRVTDTGKGIAATHLETVFNRFWQGDARDRRGAGLGLAIVKGLVELHGGQVWAESQLGGGTTLCFTVPAHAPKLLLATEFTTRPNPTFKIQGL